MMRTSCRKTLRTVFTLSMAAVLSISAAGCAGAGSGAEAGEGASFDEQEIVTIYVTDAPAEEDDPAGPESASADRSSDGAMTAASGSSSDGAMTAASGGSSDKAMTAASDGAMTASSGDPAADGTTGSAETASTENTASAADPSGEENAGAADTGSEGEDSSSTAAGLADPVPAGGAGVPAASQDGSASTGASAETAQTDRTGDENDFASDDGADDAQPVREGPDTELKESVLYEALKECTGWGQSAGSSLRAANAATRLLRWANLAETGKADKKVLEDTVAAEIGNLSADEMESFRNNWSSVSYDVSMILDDFDEIAYLLEDAGCIELAREASTDSSAVSNWKAAEKALQAALR